MAEETLRKIDSIFGVINTHPEFDSCYTRCSEKEKRRALQTDAMRHSLSIEGTTNSKEYAGLKKAEELLYVEGVDVSVLSRIGYIAEPKNGRSGFRLVDPAYPNQIDTNAKTGFRVHPPLAREVPSQIENLIYYLENTKDHPIVRAAEAHLDFVRIHPYTEGNGRIARILENYCLGERGYTAAVIPKDERTLYWGLLQNALEERTVKGLFYPGRRGKNDSLFIDFIESKVLNSVKELQKEVNLKRAFRVDLKGNYDPSLIFSLAEKMKSHGRVKEGVKVKIDRRHNGFNGTTFQVIGNIGRKDLDDIFGGKLGRSAKIRLHYQISPLGQHGIK